MGRGGGSDRTAREGRVVDNPFTAERRYTVVYADPPWQYRDRATAGRRGVGYKYPLLDDTDVARLPVADIVADDALLFLWVTWPKLPEVLPVVESWGFTYKTAAFVWVKRSAGAAARLMWGMGSWTRANTEPCLLGIRGRPKRASAGVHQVVEAPPMRHSEKPPEVRERIVDLVGDVPRIELFARTAAPGWDAWGNEAETGPGSLAEAARRDDEVKAWIVARVREAGAVRPAEVRRHFDLTGGECTPLLRDLVKAGALERHGGGSNVWYTPPGEWAPPPPGPPRPPRTPRPERPRRERPPYRPDPEHTEWILDRATRLGEVRPFEVREHFRIPAERVQRTLAALCQTGQLQRVGRGRGTRYVPAPPAPPAAEGEG